MGLAMGKCCARLRNRNSVDVAAEQLPRVLLLGLGGSGKTEVGHTLSRKRRLDFEATNGVQHFETQLPDGGRMSVTEVGGNAEMQKIWHHYFLTTMAIIYCFDLSGGYETLRASFEQLRSTLTHSCVRGKPVLLVATKSDLADDGVQLYDIENSFQLEALARHCASSIRLCHHERSADNLAATHGFGRGLAWLSQYLTDNCDVLRQRIKCDTNMRNWQNQTAKLISDGQMRRIRYRRFPKGFRSINQRSKLWRLTHSRSHRPERSRPETAPPSIYSIASRPAAIEQSASASNEDAVNEVPNTTRAAQAERA